MLSLDSRQWANHAKALCLVFLDGDVSASLRFQIFGLTRLGGTGRSDPSSDQSTDPVLEHVAITYLVHASLPLDLKRRDTGVSRSLTDGTNLAI